MIINIKKAARTLDLSKRDTENEVTFDRRYDEKKIVDSMICKRDLAIDLFTQPGCLHYLEPRRLGPPLTRLRLTDVHKERNTVYILSLRSSCFRSDKKRLLGIH